ncbi:hypothetical protein niasHS_004243 [Heterodera schachtii]|uniref:Uncharacterized protein n=1 Tax=Heterodera schachtii TaxID=97005 RepID=A0ABD2JND9_HETSC
MTAVEEDEEEEVRGWERKKRKIWEEGNGEDKRWANMGRIGCAGSADTTHPPRGKHKVAEPNGADGYNWEVMELANIDSSGGFGRGQISGATVSHRPSSTCFSLESHKIPVFEEAILMGPRLKDFSQQQ